MSQTGTAVTSSADATDRSAAVGVAAVILAAGSGTRMGARKQFLDLSPGERIIDRVVRVCRASASWVGVVLPDEACWDGDPVDAVVAGGADRLASLAAGMAAIPPGAEVVVVHSASHPLASTDLVDRLVAAVETGGAHGAVPVLDAVDVIKRRGDGGTLTTVGREGLGTAQAPMAWSRATLDRALAARHQTGGTVVEESAAVEAIGGRVVSVAGELTNLHVTDPRSLEVIRRLADLTAPDR